MLDKFWHEPFGPLQGFPSVTLDLMVHVSMLG